MVKECSFLGKLIYNDTFGPTTISSLQHVYIGVPMEVCFKLDSLRQKFWWRWLWIKNIILSKVLAIVMSTENRRGLGFNLFGKINKAFSQTNKGKLKQQRRIFGSSASEVCQASWIFNNAGCSELLGMAGYLRRQEASKSGLMSGSGL